jgi:hypothetical protein
MQEELEMEQDQQVEETTMVDETVGEVLQEETVENLNPEEPEENN